MFFTLVRYPSAALGPYMGRSITRRLGLPGEISAHMTRRYAEGAGRSIRLWN